MTRTRTGRRGRTAWRSWAGSPIEQLCDEELAVIVEHHGYSGRARFAMAPAARFLTDAINRERREPRRQALAGHLEQGDRVGQPLQAVGAEIDEPHAVRRCGAHGLPRVGRDDDLTTVPGGAHA